VPQQPAVHPDLHPDLRSLLGQAAAGPSSVPHTTQGPYPLHHQHQQQYQQQQQLAWHQQPEVPLPADPPAAAPTNPSSQHQSEGPSSRGIEGTVASEGEGESAGRPAGHSRAAAAKIRGGKRGVTGKTPAVAPAKKAGKKRRAGAAAADVEGDVEASEVTEEHTQAAAGAPKKGTRTQETPALSSDQQAVPSNGGLSSSLLEQGANVEVPICRGDCCQQCWYASGHRWQSARHDYTTAVCTRTALSAIVQLTLYQGLMAEPTLAGHPGLPDHCVAALTVLLTGRGAKRAK